MLLGSILKDRSVYLLKDIYDTEYVYCALIFDKEENEEEEEKLFHEVKCTIDEIKQSFDENGDTEDWEVSDVLKSLHDCYDFQELYFNCRKFYI